MALYTKTTNFAAKDALASGDSNKIVKGSEIGAEFDNIQTAFAGVIAANGSQAATADIPLGGFKLTNLASGSAPTDSANLGQVQGAPSYLTAVAGTNTVTATAAPVPSAYSAGQLFRFIPANSNTGATTLNVSSIGAKSIFLNGAALLGYELRKNCPVEVLYDGTQFHIVGGAHGDGIAIGRISDRGFGTVPSGHLQCDGSAVSRATYPDLFAVLGTTWGAGDGSTTFNVPNLARRVTVGSGGTGTGTLANTVGSTGGEETHVLTVAEMPSHTHNVNYQSLLNGGGTGGDVKGTGSTVATTSTGSDGAHNNVQPSAVVLKVIKF